MFKGNTSQKYYYANYATRKCTLLSCWSVSYAAEAAFNGTATSAAAAAAAAASHTAAAAAGTPPLSLCLHKELCFAYVNKALSTYSGLGKLLSSGVC